MVSNQQSIGHALLTLAAVAILLGGMYLARSILGFVLLAIFFALLCYPIKRWLIGHGLAPTVALTLITGGLAAIVFGIVLLVGGIDYAALWGILLFFLSYVPYIGIFIASVPPTILRDRLNIRFGSPGDPYSCCGVAGHSAGEPKHTTRVACAR